MRRSLRVLTLTILLAIMALRAASPGGVANPGAALGATTVKVCGEVSLYVQPTALLAGALTVGGVAYVVAAGTVVPASVDVGADVCLEMKVNASGNVTEIVAVDANITATVKICGKVTAYGEASLTKTGNLTIGGRTFVLALGADLPASFDVGADLCATLELNAFGQVSDGSATANITAILTVCGQVTAYTAATASGNGSLTIGGVTRTIAAGASASSGIKAGVYAKLRLELNAFARISKITALSIGASLDAACGASITAPSPTPTPTPAPDATPTPVPTPDPNGPGAPAEGPDVCPPGGTASDGSGGPSGNAPQLPDTSTAERAGQVIGTAAFPFVLLGLAVFTWAFLRRLQARPELATYALTFDDFEEEHD